MDGVALRFLLVIAVVAVAIVAGSLANRWQQPTPPRLDVSPLGLAPGIVAFTSTQCDNCKRVMAMLATIDAPVREVTHELEAGLFGAAGVEAVPLIVVTNSHGDVIRQLAGTPSKRAVLRALRKAGW